MNDELLDTLKQLNILLERMLKEEEHIGNVLEDIYHELKERNLGYGG